jgi:hypothetical protein
MNYWTYNVFWFFLQLYLKYFSFWREFCKNIIINLHILNVILLFLSDFNQSWIFYTDFLKIFSYKISWKSIQWDSSCSVWKDGWRDRCDQANSHFSQFCEYAYEQHLHTFETWYAHSSAAEVLTRLGYDDVVLGKQFPELLRIVLPSPSGSNSHCP